MADNFYGEIAIPTCFITDEVLERAIDVSSNEWEEKNISFFSDSEATNGKFEDFEGFLVENKIPFDRFSEGYTESIPEIRKYRPEGVDVCVVVDHNDRLPYIPTSRLEALVKIQAASVQDELKKLIQEYDPHVKDLKEYTKDIEK